MKNKVMIYQITYELNSESKDYANFFAELSKFDSSIQFLKNSWFVKSEKQTSEISNALQKLIDEKDSLFVCRFDRKEIAGWISSSAVKWLKEN